MDIPREDFLMIRQLLAQHGMEVTPDELMLDIEQITGEPVVLQDEPGLVSFIREHGGRI